MTFITANAQVSTSPLLEVKNVDTIPGEVVARGWVETPGTRSNASNGQVPFKALMLGSAAFTSPTTVEFHTTGNATHLGRFVSSGGAVLDPPGSSVVSPCIPNVHTETLTAANGDDLVIRMVNVACPTGPYTYHGVGQWTVVSGTGRFRNVTGQGTNEGHADFETHTFEMAFTGTLSR